MIIDITVQNGSLSWTLFTK